MYDKELFKKICSLSCSLDELKKFCKGLDKKEYDLDSPFEKYYSVDAILKCIKLCQNGRITREYIDYWSTAYSWVIMAGFKAGYNDLKNESISLKLLLIWNIVDWLDSLSFYEEDFFDLEEYTKTFRTLDSIYKSEKKWKAYFCYTNELYDDDVPVNDIAVMLVNEAKGVYYKIYSDGCDFKECVFEDKFIETNDLDILEKELKAKSYKEL